LNLIQSSDPGDEVLVVNFSGNSYLDQDFTSDVGLPNELCIQGRCKAAQPSTTSIVAPATHLKNNLRLEKKILLVITDGEDNMSRDTLPQARRSFQQKIVAAGERAYSVRHWAHG
jgi:hypothetical protein